MITLYNVVSSDGYITERNGEEDFIPDDAWNDFILLCEDYDILVMGRKTYEALQNYNVMLLKQLEDLPIEKIVVSRDAAFHPKGGYGLVTSPEDIDPDDGKILLSSGPSLNTSFLKLGMIDYALLNILPVTIAGRLKVFNDEIQSPLALVHEEKKEGGRKLCFYQVKI